MWQSLGCGARSPSHGRKSSFKDMQQVGYVAHRCCGRHQQHSVKLGEKNTPVETIKMQGLFDGAVGDAVGFGSVTRRRGGGEDFGTQADAENGPGERVLGDQRGGTVGCSGDMMFIFGLIKVSGQSTISRAKDEHRVPGLPCVHGLPRAPGRPGTRTSFSI